MSLIREALKKAALERTEIAGEEQKPAETKAVVPSPVSSPVVSSVDPLVVCHTAPQSLEAEQYRNLRAQLYLSSNGGNRQVFMITSGVAGEGKSLTAVNLAIAMSQDPDKRVILVDADLRTPAVHKLLRHPAHPGLSEYLAEGAPLESVVSSCQVPRLSVLCAGSPSKSPSELIGSSKMKHLIEELRKQFYSVIFDACPILPVSDSRILGALVDGVILVVRAERTPRETVAEVIQRLGSANLLGIVLNDVEPLSLSYHYRETMPGRRNESSSPAPRG